LNVHQLGAGKPIQLATPTPGGPPGGRVARSVCFPGGSQSGRQANSQGTWHGSAAGM